MNDLTGQGAGMSKSNNKSVSPNRALIILILSIFFVEVSIMVVFLVLPPLPPVIETLVDATGLILLVSPIVYRFAILPLHEQMAKTTNAVDQLETLNLELEKRVSDRTQELEKANEGNIRRTAQFESIARIARIISSTQTMEELLLQITEAISEKFGFYHVGVFLLDGSREYAVLVAANSAGGQRMLERNHRLPIGGTSIVGFVTDYGQPRVALDVGLDAVYFNNPDLPETHSEIALPLRVGANVFGALDVQSVETNAFAQEDITILSTLADQVGIAIQNARSYQQSSEALAQAEAASRQMGEQQWQQFLVRRPVEGYYFDGIEAKAIGPHDRQRNHGLTIPLTLRGTHIGTIKLSAPDPNRTWTEDEIAIAQATAERTSLALESARLLQEAQKRAAKERTIGQISAKIGSLVNLENIVQTAIQELGSTLPGTEVAIQFTPDDSPKK
ncbi:MAG: GAF domain-containing protein [Anaerolineales bacterium]|nr:GAF domain-containing protein [Anaerolineales bacterium]